MSSVFVILIALAAIGVLSFVAWMRRDALQLPRKRTGGTGDSSPGVVTYADTGGHGGYAGHGGHCDSGFGRDSGGGFGGGDGGGGGGDGGC